MSYGLRITEAGAAMIEAAVSGGNSVNLATFAIGNGTWGENELPDELKGEQHEFPLDNNIGESTDTNVVILRGIIPSDIGGFGLTEISIKTDAGETFAIMQYPVTYLPIPEESEVVIERPVEFYINVGAPDVIEVPFNPQVSATQAWVTAEIDLNLQNVLSGITTAIDTATDAVANA